MNVEVDADFSGVLRIDRGGETVHTSAHGFADRAHGVPMRSTITVDDQGPRGPWLRSGP